MPPCCRIFNYNDNVSFCCTACDLNVSLKNTIDGKIKSLDLM